jgi:hypothetical protein
LQVNRLIDAHLNNPWACVLWWRAVLDLDAGAILVQDCVAEAVDVSLKRLQLSVHCLHAVLHSTKRMDAQNIPEWHIDAG